MNECVRLQQSDAKTRLVVAVVTAALLVGPFWLVSFPPITDLAQHVAQVSLLLDAFHNPNSKYLVQWLTPYSLVYTVVLISWVMVPPLLLGKVTMTILVSLSVLVLHWFSSRRRCALENTVLASIFFYSAILYWGFLQFFFGFPMFLIWIEIISRRKSQWWKQLLLIFIWSFVLYFSHIFWLAVSGLVLVGTDLMRRDSLGKSIVRWSMLAPTAGLACIWYPTLISSNFDSPTVWMPSIASRFYQLNLWPQALLGGLKGNWEIAVVVFSFLWIIIAIISARRLGGLIYRRYLLILGWVFLLFYLLFPSQHQNTILFHQRWASIGFILILLSVPAPKVIRSKVFRLAIVGAVFVAHLGITSAAWLAFENTHMKGFSTVLERLPRNARVLGLSFYLENEFFYPYSNIQMFAYCQVVKGGSLNFSFADFKPSLVIYKEERRKKWFPALEWYPHRFTPKDAAFFDYLVVQAPKAFHQPLAHATFLKQLTKDAPWVLYRVNNELLKKGHFSPFDPFDVENRDK